MEYRNLFDSSHLMDIWVISSSLLQQCLQNMAEQAKQSVKGEMNEETFSEQYVKNLGEF